MSKNIYKTFRMLSKSPLIPLLQRGSRIKQPSRRIICLPLYQRGYGGFCSNYRSIKVLRFRSLASVFEMASKLDQRTYSRNLSQRDSFGVSRDTRAARDTMP